MKWRWAMQILLAIYLSPPSQKCGYCILRTRIASPVQGSASSKVSAAYFHAFSHEVVLLLVISIPLVEGNRLEQPSAENLDLLRCRCKHQLHCVQGAESSAFIAERSHNAEQWILCYLFCLPIIFCTHYYTVRDPIYSFLHRGWI